MVAALGCGKGKTGAQAGEAMTLPEANRFLQMWTMTGKPGPATLNELTNMPCFTGKQLPSPPPGKRLVLDPATHQIVLADQ
jgi:hypothetical protein